MRIGTAAAVIVALALSACSKKEPNAKERYAAAALQNARELMNDPSAVKFKDVTVLPSAKCMYGSILGKNGFGAYAGYHEFVWVDGKIFIKDSDIPGEYNDYHLYINKWMDCTGEQIKLKPDQRVLIPQA